MPSAGLLLFPEDVEADDWLHNPDPNDKDGEKFNIWNKRGLTNVGGLTIMVLAILTLFIVYPILYAESRPLACALLLMICRTFVQEALTPKSACSGDDCLSTTMALLVNQRVGLIDPDTPDTALTKTGVDGTALKLVVSLQRACAARRWLMFVVLGRVQCGWPNIL